MISTKLLAENLPEKAVELVNKSAEGIKSFNDMNAQYGIHTNSSSIIQWLLIFLVAVLVLMIVYIMTSGKDKFATKMKKEMDIDDLQEKISSQTQVMRELSQGIYSLIDKIDNICSIIKNTKELSNEEMYSLLLTRLHNSIKDIADGVIDLVERNDLWANKTTMKATIRGIIEDFVNDGRDFIYSRNYDQRIIKSVFDDTDTAMDLAEEALWKIFNIFYENTKDLDPSKIPDIHYKTLIRGVKGLKKSMLNSTTRMLRAKVLGEVN